MALFRFYILDITYKIKDDKAVVWMFGKTSEGKQIAVIDESFRPYFYIIPNPGADITDKVKNVSAEVKNNICKVTDVEEVKKKILGKDVTALKVYVNTPKGVPHIRNEVKGWDDIKACYEYDIKYVRRYMIDKGITPFTLVEAEGEPETKRTRVPVVNATRISQYSDDTLKEPKIIAIDIETYNPHGKNINPEEDPIIMMSFYGKEYKKVLTWKKFNTEEKYIEFVKSELDLISRFKKIIEECKPDIITGYFSDGFDLPYIDSRAKKYRIKLDLGLDYSDMQISGKTKMQASITGIVHLDILSFIIKNFGRGGDLDSFKLDNVAEKLLGDKKIEVDMDSLADVWDNHPEKIEEYCRYNLHDSRLAYGLCVKMLPNIIELVKIVGLPLFDIPRLGYSQLVEWFIIRQAPNFNEITLEKPHYNEVKERRMQSYAGGFVFEPTPGIYHDIVVLDFRSLYPTIIASHNISPGTLNCECCIEKDIAPTEDKKYWFCKKKKGFIPTIIEDLITRRMRIKEMISKEDKKDPLLVAREQSLKVLANSFYGYLGFFNARWYSIESAKSITAWARHYIKSSMKKAEEEGFKTIYGDTDSVFIALEGKTTDDALNFVDKINSTLPGVMELEFEGFYPSGIFVSSKGKEAGAKKKYALLNEKEDIEIKGFETIRRNWSFIAKEVQKKVLEIVLKENDAEKALKYVKDIVSKMKNHEVPVEKMVIHTQLQKDIEDYSSIGPHVAAAQIMRKKGIPVGPGSLIKFVVIKGRGRIRDKVKLAEDAKKEDYDSDYYIDSQIIPSVDKIFESLGITKDEIEGKASQSKLGQFFG